MEAASVRIKRTKAAVGGGGGSGSRTELPDELLEEILARLPAKSAGRFRCVSRSWAATLSSASFADLHLRRANPAGQHKVFLIPDASSAETDLYACQVPGGGGEIHKLMRLDAIQQPEMLFPLTKPCRGLVLLWCPPARSYYACNPSTGALLPVPDTRIDLGGDLHVSYGLGYCAAARAHKLARLLCFVRGGAPLAARCEVLALGADAHWRASAAGPPPLRNVSFEQAAVFLNGRLHFVAYGGDIVTFDVADETFGVMTHPAEVPATGSPCLTELGGYLCVSHGLANLGEPYTMWLLRDYEAQRWEKLCSLDQTAWPDAELGVVPVEIFNDGPAGSRRSKIMFKKEPCRLFTVDLESDGGKHPDVLFSQRGVAGTGGCAGFVCRRLGLYEESLTMPGRSSEQIVFSSPLAAAWAEVLRRLPARTVAPLNLVCRDWRALISTDRFMRSHAVHGELNDAPRIIFADCNRVGRFTPLEDSINYPARTPPLMAHGSGFVCSQPCHGLVLWGHASTGYFVCNPSIGGSNLRVTFGDMDTADEAGTPFFAGRVGLGYDTATNTHVLARLSYGHRDYTTREYRLECAVRNMRDAAWYLVDPPPRPVANAPPVDVAGKLFWAADNALGPPAPAGGGGGGEIVAMDNRTAEFEVLPGPPCGRLRLVSLLPLRGALAAVCAHRGSNTLEVWTMRERAWSMECRIDLGEFSPEYSCDTAVLLAMDRNGGDRVLLSTGRSLGWYDPRMGAIQSIYSLGTRGPGNKKFVPVVYNESLFRPDGLRRLPAPANLQQMDPN